MDADRFCRDPAADYFWRPGVADFLLDGFEGPVIPHAPPTSSTRDAAQPKTGRTRAARIAIARRDGKTRADDRGSAAGGGGNHAAAAGRTAGTGEPGPEPARCFGRAPGHA